MAIDLGASGGLAVTGLPARRNVAVRGGPERVEIRVALKIVTPCLGGGAIARELDHVDVVRVPSIRGHLRFWWRALHGHEFSSVAELAKREAEIWGGAADHHQAEGQRSPVELRVVILDRGTEDETDIQLFPKKGVPETKGAYALFVAKSTNASPQAPRRVGTRFELIASLPLQHEEAVRSAIKAWIVFGGYGSRTRRGLGTLTVTADEASWLPRNASREALIAYFGRDVFAKAGTARDMPVLASSTLLAGSPKNDAIEVWSDAIRWLKDFRQKPKPGHAPEPNQAFARRPPGQGNIPGPSNWPEADMLRLAQSGNWAHKPQYMKQGALPRAGFGLPIVCQFKDKPPKEPVASYDIKWRRRVEIHGEKKLQIQERLASPLILKALPLQGGRFAPVALWLERALPADGEVVAMSGEKVLTQAPFDVLVPPGDTAWYAPLNVGQVPQGRRLRTAFRNWLLQNSHAKVVVEP